MGSLMCSILISSSIRVKAAMSEKSYGSDRQSHIGVTAVEVRDTQSEVVFTNFVGELDCFLVQASRPNQESNHRSCIGGVARRGLYRIRHVLPAHRIARDKSRGLHNGLQGEGVLDLAVGALALVDLATDPMRLIMEFLKSVSQLIAPARFNDISCDT